MNFSPTKPSYRADRRFDRAPKGYPSRLHDPGKRKGNTLHRARLRQDAFKHDALFYSGEEDFVSSLAPWLREGIAAGEPALVVVSARKIALLREAVGPSADAIVWADMAEVGTNPARIIPLWREFLTSRMPLGGSVRGVGEPIYPERSPDELIECHRHESMLNLAFEGGPPWWLVCPYDTRALDPAVVSDARKTHPYLALGTQREPSEDYSFATALSHFESSLSPPPEVHLHVDFGPDDVRSVRSLVAQQAMITGMTTARAGDFVVAVNEVITNSIRHGGGRGRLLLWRSDKTLFCDVSDSGQIGDPLVGRGARSYKDLGGRGLWMVHHLCDLAQIRSDSTGTTIRLHMHI